MVAAVDAEQDRSIALLERLVNRNSGSLNLEGVRAAGLGHVHPADGEAERLVNRNSGSLNLEGVRAVGQMMRAELGPLEQGDAAVLLGVDRRHHPLLLARQLGAGRHGEGDEGEQQQEVAHGRSSP